MKRLLIFWIFVGVFSQGQTLTKMPRAGETYFVHNVLDSTYSVGTQGTGKVWDFRGLNLSGYSVIKYVSPFATPWYSFFPKAGIAIDQSMPMWMQFDYYGLENNSQFMYYGSYYCNDVECWGCIYQDPMQMFVYPCSYGTTFTDTFYTSQNNPYREKGSIFFNADASGTLLTDFGTFNNVLRVHTIISKYQETSDATVYSLENHYAFYSPSHAIPIIKVSGNFIQVYNPKFTSLTQAQLEEIKVFPTFVSQNLHVTIPERKQAEILIFNINGQEVFRTSLKNSRNTFDLSDLPAGMYFIEVRLEEHRKFFKIIKQ